MWLISPADLAAREADAATELKRVVVQARHRAPLEPGQGGGGPGSDGLEAAIQERLIALLRADGRFTPTATPGDFPERIDADLGLFLSLDAAAKPQAGGYYFGFPAQPASAELAGLIAEEIGAIPGRPSRRADNNPPAVANYFGFARMPSAAPKVLVQHGFVTNPSERQWIAAHTDDLARAEYLALCRFLHLEPRSTQFTRVMVQARHQTPLEPGQSAGGRGAGAFEAAVQQRLGAWLAADGRFAVEPFPGDLPTSVDSALALVLSVDAAANAQAGGYYFAYPDHPPSKQLASLLAEEFAAIPDRPARRDDNNPPALSQYFGFARLPAAAPRVLVQHGFVTKPAERDWLNGHIDALARAEYRALCRHLKWQPLERPPS